MKANEKVMITDITSSPATSLVDEAVRQKVDLLVMGIVGDEPQKALRKWLA